MTLFPWKIKKSRYLVKDQWLTLRADTCETVDGVQIDPFYVFEKRDWAHVVGFDSDGKILIIRQYRHGSGTICAEIPCGILDETDASPLEAAKRELLEETGCVSDHFEEIGKIYANPARQTNIVHCFVAYDVKRVSTQNLDEMENIEFEFVDLDTLFKLIDSGEFCQSLHVSSVFLTLRKCGLLSMKDLKGSQIR
ncbi:NUDIX hydrolase [bacterium]|nr:NUDIX hydrolase [bacterium]